MNEAENYKQYMVLKEKVDLSLNRFHNENKEFNDSFSTFMTRKNKWIEYHLLRYESKTISEIEAVHLADVMETSTELLIAFEKNVNNTTHFLQSMGDYYKEITIFHKDKTSPEVIDNLPELVNYTEKYFSRSEKTIAEIKREWAAVNILKQKVEIIFNKYLN